MDEPGSVLTGVSSRANRARVPAPFPVHRWAEHMPAVVVLPRTAQQVSEIVKLANRARIPVVPRAGGTGLNDGAVPLRGGILVDVKRMNQIHEIDLADRTVTVGPGISMLKLNEELKQYGVLLPGHAGVVPVLLGRRADRMQRLLAAGLPLRSHPRPGHVLRDRAADRGDHPGRRRWREEDPQVLHGLPPQAPVHGSSGHARHRHRGDPGAGAKAGGGVRRLLRLRRLPQRPPHRARDRHLRASPRSPAPCSSTRRRSSTCAATTRRSSRCRRG